MKQIVIGDIHGRTIWKDIIEKEKDADKIIFVGDYFDSFDIGTKKEVKNFKEILSFKKENSDKVILLFGNHDYHYLPEVYEVGEHYSRFRPQIYKQVGRRIKTGVLSGTFKMCYVYKDILISHAGVTKTWCENVNVDIDNLEESINSTFKENVRRFKFYMFDTSNESTRISDPYGDDKYQSPIWVRPFSLVSDKLEGFRQVVGHTRTKTQGSNHYEGVYFVDCLDTSNGYLVIQDEKLIHSFL